MATKRNAPIARTTKQPDRSVLAASRVKSPFMGTVSVTKTLLQHFGRNAADDAVSGYIGNNDGSCGNDRTASDRHSAGDHDIRTNPNIVTNDDRSIDVV